LNSNMWWPWQATLQYTHNAVYHCSCDNARVIIMQCHVNNSTLGRYSVWSNGACIQSDPGAGYIIWQAFQFIWVGKMHDINLSWHGSVSLQWTVLTGLEQLLYMQQKTIVWWLQGGFGQCLDIVRWMSLSQITGDHSVESIISIFQYGVLQSCNSQWRK